MLIKKRNKWLGLLLTVTLIFCVNVITVFAAASPTAKDRNWVSQIRPGIMGGNSTTDYFLDIFLPLWSNDKALVFFDPHIRHNHGDYFDSLVQDEMEENIGAGARFLLLNDQLILGFNAFYDIMQTKEKNNYNQLGVGMEVLSKWVDFRANYYHPINTTYNYLPAYDHYDFGSSTILLYKGREEVLKGFDVEMGLLIPFISDYIETRVAGGAYFYFPEFTSSFNGYRGRVEVRPVRMINLVYEIKRDEIRGTEQFWGGYLEIPFSFTALVSGKNPFAGIKDALAFGKGARSVPARMTEKIIRDRNIVNIKYTPTQDPVTAPGGEDIIYVNQEYAGEGAGEGTLEAPYKDIVSVYTDPRWLKTGGGAIVYVFTYDGVADTYNLATPVEMLPNNILWGEGYKHPLWKLGGGPSPILDGDNGGTPIPYVIKLANNNEIMGLTIQHGMEGISGENIAQTYIHDNTITYNPAPVSAIHIENNFTDGTTYDPGEGKYGVSGTALSYRINNNTIENNLGNAVFLSTNITHDGDNPAGLTDTPITTEFIGNTVYQNGNGIMVDLNIASTGISNSPVLNTFTGNTITYNGEYAVSLNNALYASTEVGEKLKVGGSVEPTVGNVEALITASPVTNVFSDNTIISYNQYYGIRLSNSLGAYVENSVDITGNVKAGISDSAITNIFNGNDIIYAVTQNPAIFIDGNYIRAEADQYDSTVTGNVSAAITNSPIINNFTNNILNNYATGGIGIKENYAKAEAAAEEGSTITGNLSATNNSGVANIFANNTMASRNETLLSGQSVGEPSVQTSIYGYGGIYISENKVKAEATAKEGSDIGGNVSATNTVGIANTFTDNTISGEVAYADADQPAPQAYPSVLGGIYIGENKVNAEATSKWGADVTGDVTAANDAGIVNTFTGNTINRYVEVERESGVEVPMPGNSSGINILENYVLAEAKSQKGSDVEGDVSAINNGGIANTFTENTIAGYDLGVVIGVPVFSTQGYSEGGYGFYGGNYVSAEAESEKGSDVTGSVLATNNAGIANVFTGNNTNDNRYGIAISSNEVSAEARSRKHSTVGVDVAATNNAGIVNTFTDNTSNNNEYAVLIGGNSVLAEAKSEKGSEVGGNVSAVNDKGSGIANTFTGNSIDPTEPINMAGISIYDNYVEAEATSQKGSTVTGNVIAGNTGGIFNTFTANTITGSGMVIPREGEVGQPIPMLEYSGIFIGGNYVEAEAISQKGSKVDGYVHATNDAGIANTFNGTENNGEITGNNISGYMYGIAIYENSVEAEAKSQKGSSVGAGVAATNNEGIINTFENNTLTGNMAGIYIGGTIVITEGSYGQPSGELTGGNYVEAEALSQRDSSVNGSLTATNNAGIVNTFTDNIVNENFGGIAIVGNYVEAEAKSQKHSTIISGDVIAANNAGVANTFTGNTVNNEIAGIEILENIVEAEAKSQKGSTVGGNVSAINTAGIVNTFTDNKTDKYTEDITALGDDEDDTFGIFIAGNSVKAEAESQKGSTVTGSVIATNDTASGIANTFTGNTVTNYTYGILIGVPEAVEYYIPMEITNGNYVTAEALSQKGSEVGTGVFATNKAGITNTFNAMVVDDITIGNEITGVTAGIGISGNYVEAEATSQKGSEIIAGNVIAQNDAGVVNIFENTMVTGDFNPENQVAINEKISSDEYGISIYQNIVNAQALSQDESEVIGNVSAINNAGIANTFTGNAVTNMFGDGIIIGSNNEFFGGNYVTANASSQMDSKVTGNVSATNEGKTGGITNTFTDNKVGGTIIVKDEPVNVGNYDDGIKIDANSVTASAKSQFNSYVDGDLIATNNAGIENIFNALVSDEGTVGNTVSNNGGNGIIIGGFFVGNSVKAEATSQMYSDVDGDVIATNNAGITNTVADSTVENNGGIGIDIGDFGGNSVSAKAVSQWHSEIDDGDVIAKNTVGITNTFTDNVVTGNSGFGIYEGGLFGGNSVTAQAASQMYSSVYGDVSATNDTGAGITNIFDNNTVTGTDGKGISVKNYLGASAKALMNSYVDGDLSAENNGGIVNTFTDNTVSDNSDTGIYVTNFINSTTMLGTNNVTVNGDINIVLGSITDEFTGNTVTNNIGDLTGIHVKDSLYGLTYGDYNIDKANITETFTDNVVTGNSGDGIYIDTDVDLYDYDVFMPAPGYTIEGPEITLTMRGNTVSNNVMNGVNLYTYIDGPWTYSADLGTEDEAGNNSLADNGNGFGLVNNTDTGVYVDAINNWWGTSLGPDDPDTKGSISGDAYYDPWLTSDPNATE